MKRWAIGLLIAALALTVAGCSAVEDKIGEEVGEGIAGAIVGGDVDVDDGSVTISGEDGDVTVSDGGNEIPDGFPGDFPVYDDADLDSTSSITSGEGTTFYLTLTSGDEPEAVYDWFKAEFEAGGWSIVNDMNMNTGDGMTAIISVEKGDVEGSVTMDSADPGTDFGVIVTEK
ncbi:MAG: hypothetical protein RBS17_00045 [Coriobacteriia bacterium]|nr:hypothetical protein [Coriobacteriia bacterium]